MAQADGLSSVEDEPLTVLCVATQPGMAELTGICLERANERLTKGRATGSLSGPRSRCEIGCSRGWTHCRPERLESHLRGDNTAKARGAKEPSESIVYYRYLPVHSSSKQYNRPEQRNL